MTALEKAILPALQHEPCIVAFSGGRDSSAILAVAASLAQREALSAPIPASLRFPGHAETEEAYWQELVIRKLRIRNWERLEIGEELGLLGPVARSALVRHGLLWPSHIHSIVPLLRLARGGAMLTGFGGDEMLGSWAWGPLFGALGGTLAPQARDLKM